MSVNPRKTWVKDDDVRAVFGDQLAAALIAEREKRTHAVDLIEINGVWMTPEDARK